MIPRTPKSTQSRSSAASDVYKRQTINIKLDETAPAMTSLTAIIDGSSITGTSTIACEVGCTVSSIKVLLSEPVTVVGTPVVTMGGGSIPAGTPYGTISLDPLDTTNKTLIITPYPGNEKSGLVGDFTFRVAAGAVKDAWGNENAETTFILHVGNAVAPTMSAISFAGKTGTVSGTSWTVDISDITNEAFLDTGSMTGSEASTLQSKTVDGVDVSGWGFKTVTLAAGENTGSIKSLLGFTQDVTFNILKVQDTNHDGYLTVVVDLKDASNNTTPVTILSLIHISEPTRPY